MMLFRALIHLAGSMGLWCLPLGLIVACGILAFVTFNLLRRSQHRKCGRDLPPCVPGVPLFGNIFGIDPLRPHVTLTEWGRKHGDIYTLKVFFENVIVINSIDLIKDALITKSTAFAGRPNIFRIDYGFHYAKDIIFGDYNRKWCHLKKTAAHALRMFGSGVNHVDDVIRDEMVALVHALEVRRGQAFDPRVTLMTAVVNALTATVIGKRYDHADPEMAQYKLTTRLFSESCSPTRGMELDMLPWLRFLPNKNFQKLTHAREMLDKLIEEELKTAKERYDVNNVRCVLDVLFKARDESGSDPDLILTDTDVRSVFIDLLVSGTFTTAIAMSTFVLLMMKLPEVQSELRREIAQTIGHDRLPCSADRDRLPVIESFILEIMRYLSHVPLSLPHFTTEATDLGGYNIPKGTRVLLNFWSVHHDERIWEDPWTFQHRRFLDNNGVLLPPSHIKRKCLIPFSAGKRACLGETIARERLFLFMTSLLQNFHFRSPEGVPAPSPDPRDFDLGLILEPTPFLTCAIPERVYI